MIRDEIILKIGYEPYICFRNHEYDQSIDILNHKTKDLFSKKDIDIDKIPENTILGTANYNVEENTITNIELFEELIEDSNYRIN